MSFLLAAFKVAKFAKKAVKVAKIARDLKTMKRRVKRGDYIGAASSLESVADNAKTLGSQAKAMNRQKNLAKFGTTKNLGRKTATRKSASSVEYLD